MAMHEKIFKKKKTFYWGCGDIQKSVTEVFKLCVRQNLSEKFTRPNFSKLLSNMKYGTKWLLSLSGYVSKYEDKKVYPAMVSFRRVPCQGASAPILFLLSISLYLSLSHVL